MSGSLLSHIQGSKRARGSKDADEVDDAVKGTGSITQIIGDLVAQDSDPPPLVNMLNTKSYDIQELLNNMSLDDTLKMYALTQKYKLHLGKDTSIKNFADVFQAFRDVEEQHIKWITCTYMAW